MSVFFAWKYSLAADNDVAYLLVKKVPTPQPQDPAFRTNIDAGRDEAIHPVLLLNAHELSIVQ
jgi:hypothetical protein